jgi:hypothetical protein
MASMYTRGLSEIPGGTQLPVRDELLMRAQEDNFTSQTVQEFLEKLAHCIIPVYESNDYPDNRIR